MQSIKQSLGRVFTVRTSPVDSNMEYGVKYDVNKWLGDKTQEWKNFSISESMLSNSDVWHGTEITILEMNVPLYTT